jgi:endonuclease/exonuclease/phosphatase family metal-dependent hydrolase
MWEIFVLVLPLFVVLIIQVIYNCSCLFDRFNVHRVKKYYTIKHPRYHQQNLGKWSPISNFPNLDSIVTGDFRSKQDVSKKESQVLRIVTWNVEFGYKLEQVISRLRMLKPDILLLQECDCVMDNLNLNVHVAEEIAKSLKLAYVWSGAFGYEFGSSGKGSFGNAILSRFDLIDPQRVFINEIVAAYPKSALRATVVHPLGNILCYSVHLEAVTGIRERSKQFIQVLQDWKRSYSPGLRAAIIAGDLNTLGHHASRISPVHCRDSYRFSTLGMTESQWFQRNFFERGQLGYGFNDPFHKSAKEGHTLRNSLISAKFDWILLNGLTAIKKEIGVGDESDHWYVLVDAELLPSLVPPLDRVKD